MSPTDCTPPTPSEIAQAKEAEELRAFKQTILDDMPWGKGGQFEDGWWENHFAGPPPPDQIAQAKEAEQYADLLAQAKNTALLPEIAKAYERHLIARQAKEAEYARRLEAMPPIYVPVSEWFWEMYLREADEAQKSAPHPPAPPDRSRQ